MPNTPAPTDSYSASDMQVLEGLEAVRKRPGMYIGSTDSRGLQHTMWEIVDNAVDEALAGHCTRIDVYLHPDGSIEVHDNGRGIPTDVNAKLGLSGVEIAYTQLHGGGKFGGSGYGASGGLHGVGASVVNALSEKLTVEVDRGGVTHAISFRRGEPGVFSDTGRFTKKAGLRKAGKPKTKTATGTRVRYWPDRQIFLAGATIDLDKTLERARQTAFLVPGLELIVHDLRGDKPAEHRFRYDGGIVDFVEFISAGTPLTDTQVIRGSGAYTESVPVLEGEDLVTREVERTMEVEVGLKWVNEFEPDVRSFVNIIATPKGGTHVVGFERALVKAVRDAVESTRGMKTAKDGVSKDDVLEGVRAVVLVRISEPQFEGQTKEILGTAAATKIVQQVVADALSVWLGSSKAATKSQVKTVLEKVSRASVTREQVRQAKETRRRKSALESASALPAKLADCRSTDMEQTELFLIEGDSAGGTLKGARDAEFQALLPLRGKILNTLKATEKRMLDNAECAAIIAAIGAGSGKTFDLDAIRYGRTIILADADVDGSHIRCLILTLYYRYLRPYLEDGRLYSAVPPLHRITEAQTGVHHYTYTEDERLAKIAELEAGGKKVKEIQRYKGLGEMDAEQLFETTIDRSNRKLRRITLEDGAAAEATFQLLMGEEVPPRREWIIASALELDPDRIDA